MTRPMLDQVAFLNALDAIIDRHAMLSHPFYQMWSAGKLNREILAEYARQYYAHVRAFPRYVSATHANCPDLKVRQMLLENLIEEERGAENHPELWLRFGESVGATREEMREAELLPQTQASVNEFHRLTRDENYLRGVAALYAYESQIPEVSRTKREGLKEFYGIDDERAVGFFRVHEEADVDHRQMERNILARHVQTEEDRRAVLEAAEDAACALWHFLDGIQAACVSETAGA